MLCHYAYKKELLALCSKLIKNKNKKLLTLGKFVGNKQRIMVHLYISITHPKIWAKKREVMFSY